jgi:hypothetical protein
VCCRRHPSPDSPIRYPSASRTIIYNATPRFGTQMQIYLEYFCSPGIYSLCLLLTVTLLKSHNHASRRKFPPSERRNRIWPECCERADKRRKSREWCCPAINKRARPCFKVLQAVDCRPVPTIQRRPSRVLRPTPRRLEITDMKIEAQSEWQL